MDIKLFKKMLLTTAWSLNVVVAMDIDENTLTPVSKYTVDKLVAKLSEMDTARRPQRAAEMYDESVLGSVATRLQMKFVDKERREKGQLISDIDKIASESKERKEKADAALREHAARLAEENEKHNRKLKEKLSQKNQDLSAAQQELDAAIEAAAALEGELLLVRQDLKNAKTELQDAEILLEKYKENVTESEGELKALREKLLKAQEQGDAIAESMYELQISNEEKLKAKHKQEIEFLTAKISTQNEDILRLTEVEKSREALLAVEFPKTPAFKARAKVSSVIIDDAENKDTDTSGGEVASDLFGSLINEDEVAGTPVDVKESAPLVSTDAAKKPGRRARPNVMNSASQVGAQENDSKK